MGKLALTLACGPYDRTRALADGQVQVSGVDLTYLCLEPEETFFRMLRFEEFDIAEMSLSTYLLTHLADGPFVAIPVFSSRSFRHGSIYVSSASHLVDGNAEGLIGSVVGVAEYQLTANVWIRGILAERYGVPVSSVKYRTGGLNSPGRREKFSLDLPGEIDIEPIADNRCLSEMLAAGDLDAVYSPRAPVGFPGKLRRFFADPRSEEERYFADTGVFPIMHVIVLHRRIYERSPWVAQELLKAFARAKELAYADLQRTVALSVTLPWVREEYERAVDVMGADYWAYGLAPNREVLAAFIRYAADQGLVHRQPAPDALFAPESIDQVVI